MRVMICLGQGGLRSLSVSSLFLYFSVLIPLVRSNRLILFVLKNRIEMRVRGRGKKEHPGKGVGCSDP